MHPRYRIPGVLCFVYFALVLSRIPSPFFPVFSLCTDPSILTLPNPLFCNLHRAASLVTIAQFFLFCLLVVYGYTLRPPSAHPTTAYKSEPCAPFCFPAVNRSIQFHHTCIVTGIDTHIYSESQPGPFEHGGFNKWVPSHFCFRSKSRTQHLQR